MKVYPCAVAAGGRKAPRHEIAGSRRRRRNSLYGDLNAVRLMAFGVGAAGGIVGLLR